ncbi:hypothetical protein BaRGS_00002850 [Batillaria attramentaria]|uniref:Uncharacterized protein n=1 Tax=Batillaria attramentaria TaxID=370345 RepID=A0ABD0M414_9CAEN
MICQLDYIRLITYPAHTLSDRAGTLLTRTVWSMSHRGISLWILDGAEVPILVPQPAWKDETEKQWNLAERCTSCQLAASTAFVFLPVV